MSCPVPSCNIIPPILNDNKNLIYKGIKYPIDFDIFIKYSIYFKNKQEQYKDAINIELDEENIEIKEEDMQEFINICQSKPINLNDSNVFAIRQLSYHYNVIGLQNYIKKYISDRDYLVLQSKIFNCIANDNQKDNKYDIEVTTIMKDDESIISQSFFDIINNELLLKLPVPVLFRILHNYDLKINELNEEKKTKIIDFLLIYLKHHPKRASVLFLDIDLFNRKDVVLQLINSPNIFDINMIDRKSLINLTKEFSAQNCNNIKLLKDKINVYKEDIGRQINSFNELFSQKINKIKSSLEKCNTIMLQMRNKIIENDQLKEKICQLENDIKIKDDLINEKSKNEEEIKAENSNLHQLYDDTSFIDLSCKNKDFDQINNYKGEVQLLFLQKINPKTDQCIIDLLTFLSKEKVKAKNSNNVNNFINMYDNLIGINSRMTEILYKNGSLNSPDLIEIINKIKNDFYIEILYPTDHFINIYKIIKSIDQCSKLEIGVHILSFENHYYFQNNNIEISYARIEVVDISGGENQGKFEQNKLIKNAIFMNSVKTIGDGSFYNCIKLMNITFSSSLTKIGISAFCKCESLTEISIPSSVKEIEDSAFKNCINLKRIKLDPYETSFHQNAFDGCDLLNQLIFSNSLEFIKKIENKNLYKRFTKIIIPQSVQIIDPETFKGWEFLEEVIIQSAVIIGDYAFCNCTSLKSIICESIENIGDGAFYGCSSLEYIKLPYSVEIVGSSAFKGCSLVKHLTIPSSVKYIGESAFADCKSLEYVCFITPSSLTEIESYLFSSCTNLLQVSIPSSVKTIRSSSFKGCTSLIKVDLPNSLLSIGTSSFEKCESISKITIPQSVKEIGYSCFNKCKSLEAVIFDTNSSQFFIGPCSFKDCKSLKHVILPSRIKYIEHHVFDGCTSLKQIIIPNSVKYIGNYSFNNCSSIKRITFQTDKTIFQHFTFSGCLSLNEVIAPLCIHENFYEIGIKIYNELKDFNTSCIYLRIAANHDIREAQFLYAQMLSNGEGVDVNEEEATKYYRKAVHNGHIKSICIYVFRLLNGIGVQKNEEEAASYFRIEANKRNVVACKQYAYMLENGIGVPVDIEKARKYYQMAENNK